MTRPPLRRELHGVADQVDHHPLEHVAVAGNGTGSLGELDVELQRPALEGRGDDRAAPPR